MPVEARVLKKATEFPSHGSNKITFKTAHFSNAAKIQLLLCVSVMCNYEYQYI